MLGSRRRHASTTRKDVPVLWPAVESDGERVRQPMTTNQRTTTDYGVTSSNGRNHRPTKRADADQSYAIAQSQYSTTNSSQFPMAAVAASSSSRFRTQDISRDTYDLRTYLKRKTTDRRSPRSSEERLYAPETAKQSRSGAYTRGGYPTTSSAPQGASQAYYAPISQPSHDPVIPQRERDRDKVETRERKRSEKEAARARIEEEKSRVRAYERERERERERRREEKERQRERERLKEQERRRDEKEQERLRRYKEKERARESRPRDINQVYPHQSASAQISAAAGVLKQYAESKLSSRHQQLDQLPSSSSNLALPQYGIPTQPSGSGARVQTFAEASRDDSLQSGSTTERSGIWGFKQ
ncbi:hypothetical protein BDY19DRAFT_288532 [Irpex rosettiformis]|uniref:Uncharacterized protein n=1 Tax=Irpex rosettiformis TaxID=378272 RepID=A0ACB8UIE7_9APHY|nr:hypothetical protein BDY19DRAFT_288532 [Irpex rosettiformis]